MTTPGEERPRPLADAADRAVRVVGTLSALVTALAGAGISLLTQDQANAVTAVLAGTPGLIAAIGVMLASFGIVRKAEPKVTPVASPRDNAGNVLVPGHR